MFSLLLGFSDNWGPEYCNQGRPHTSKKRVDCDLSPITNYEIRVEIRIFSCSSQCDYLWFVRSSWI
jgi:hypothetical protein